LLFRCGLDYLHSLLSAGADIVTAPRRKNYYTKPVLLCQGDLALFSEQFRQPLRFCQALCRGPVSRRFGIIQNRYLLVKAIWLRVFEQFRRSFCVPFGFFSGGRFSWRKDHYTNQAKGCQGNSTAILGKLRQLCSATIPRTATAQLDAQAHTLLSVVLAPVHCYNRTHSLYSTSDRPQVREHGPIRPARQYSPAQPGT